MKLSRIAAAAEPSATLSLNARAKELAREGLDVVMFTVGEPDFDTPDNIKQAAHRAIQSGYTKYTPAPGIPELRAAVADKLRRDNGLDYGADQIIISNGAKQALYLIMLCLIQEGDDVLIPAPYWVSYPEQVRICGARPVAVDCTGTEDLKLTGELLRKSITSASKLLVLNSPANPTGAVLRERELRDIVEVALAHGLWIVADEIYEKLIYDGLEHVSLAGLGDEAYGRVITLNGVSKTYAMTGWRIGYAAGPRDVIEAASRLQSNLTSGPNSIAQKAALEALTGPQDSVAEMRQQFQERRDLMVRLLNEVPGVSCLKPEGAFYCFPDVSGLLGRTYGGKRVQNSVQLAEALLDEVKLAVVPGSPFGAEGYVRLSYAVSRETIQEGIERLAEFAAAASRG